MPETNYTRGFRAGIEWAQKAEPEDRQQMIKFTAWLAGIEYEKLFVINLLEGHLRVCNFQAVNEWPCDVCAWASDTIEQVRKEIPSEV